MDFPTFLNRYLGHTTAQVIWFWFLSAEAQIQFQVTLYAIHGG